MDNSLDFLDPVEPQEEKSDWAKIPRTPQAQGSIVPDGWKPSVDKPIPVVRCTQIKRDGERCGRWSLRGHTKCIMHGGRLPNVQKHAAATVEAARLRLIDMADPAIDVLEDLLKPGTADAIRLKAADSVLDRAGIRGGMDINVEVEHRVDPASIVAERLREIQSRIEHDNEIVIEVEVEDTDG